MDFYHFSEQPYPEAWELGFDSLRNTIPNSLCDPRKAADIYHQRLDEWCYCDELGINIALNEHHSSATCLSASPTVPAAILARQTKNVKIMPLGFQIANRPDPVRVAEELAMIDVISRGRLVIGFVKGAPYELSPANSNPGRYMERFWESHDLILKALATRDGPFNFEGEFHHFRQVNIWPQPWQQPHPPVFIPAQSHDSSIEIAKRGQGLAVFLAGRNVKKLYESYTKAAIEAGHGKPGPEKFAYLCLVGVGDTEAEGYRRAFDIHGYLRTTGVISEPFMNPPGYMTVMGNVGWLRKNQTRGRAGHHYPATMKSGRVINQATATIPELVDSNIVFAGTPDQVTEQITEFCDYVGGIGNLIMMCHGGSLSHEDAMANLRLFAKEVMPRLKERYKTGAVSAAAE